MRLRVLVGILAWMVGMQGARAQQPSDTPRQVLDRAAQLQARGDSKGAIRALKAGRDAHRNHERIHHALALAYYGDGNAFWALKTLRDFEESHPPACTSRALQVWIHIQQANFDLAQEILDEPGCDTPDFEAARVALLRATIASQHQDTASVNDYLEQARRANRYYEEDFSLLQALTARFDPGRMPVTSWRIDLAGGWTSNGLAGSPVDPADVGIDAQSPLLQLDARLRVVIPASRAVRPVWEGQIRTLELFSATVRALSYRQPSFRAGILFGDRMPRLLLAYGFDAVQVAGSDRYEQGPLWYSEGHRFDYELEVTDLFFAFGGAGHRTYRESGRTRFEGEHGLAVVLPLADSLRLMTGVSARWNNAANEAYDSQGGTALGQAQYRLPEGFEARLNGSLSYDRYPRSRGYFPGSLGEARSDMLVRVKPGLWSPSWSGFRVGLDYEFSHRDSTAANYAYQDHRVLLHGVWVMDGDRFGIGLIPAENRQPLPHGVSSAQLETDETRIRDLMQQDEAVKRGSSCLN